MRSYGIYLFHWPIYQVIRKQAGVALTADQFVLAMAMTVFAAELSFRFVEMPIRRGAIAAWITGRGRRARRKAGQAPPWGRRLLALASITLVGFAGVSLARAQNVCVGGVECQATVAAELASTTTTAPTTTAPSTTTAPDTTPGTAPGAAATPAPVETTVAPTTAPVDPFDTNPPFAIGESVMQAARSSH